MQLKEITFKEITRDEAKPLLLNFHYLKRMPPLSIAYGAFYKDKLIGVLTFGKPPSNSLCKGIAGEEFSNKVYELNRLYTIDESPKNTESKFISYALKQLKRKNLILISYADEAMNHSGYIYQATNWLYSGLSANRTDVYVGKNGHSRTYSDDQRNFIIRSLRSRKHRYIYLCGDKRFKKKALEAIKYPIYDYYPKGEVKHYQVGDGVNKMLYNKETKEVFLESEFIKEPHKYLNDKQYNDYLEIYVKNKKDK